MSGIPFLTREPLSVVAGDTLKWKKSSLANFPSPEWVLTYELRSPVLSTPIQITAVQDGTTSDYSITVPAVTSALWIAGEYSWSAFVTKGTERKQIDSGSMDVQPDLAQASADFDGRSYVKKVLDALQALILGKATKDQQSYSINGRSISRLTPEELITWENHYKHLYQKEKRANDLKKGIGAPTKISTRFV